MNGWNRAASRTNKAHHALAKTATAGMAWGSSPGCAVVK
ncbi:hypothetical protein PC128_g27623 [Phytophthora cactorum]|nr:hypothetical protein PC128_g27623 [Phytophthora cactorum]